MVTVEQPATQPRAIETDPWSALTEELEARASQLSRLPTSAPPVTSVTTRRLLTAIAGTAETIADILDAVRIGGYSQVGDPEIAAKLRVDLDQAAAAAADLQHSVRNLNSNGSAVTATEHSPSN